MQLIGGKDTLLWHHHLIEQTVTYAFYSMCTPTIKSINWVTGLAHISWMHVEHCWPFCCFGIKRFLLTREFMTWDQQIDINNISGQSNVQNSPAGLSALFQLHSISNRRQHYSQAATAGGDTLLIVESPAKAKKIQKFLGPAYEVRILLTCSWTNATNLQSCQRAERPSEGSSSDVQVFQNSWSGGLVRITW